MDGTGGDFDFSSGRNHGEEKSGATQILQYEAPTGNNGFAQLYAYDPEHTSLETNAEDLHLKLDYEMHMGTKLDYIFFQKSRLLQPSEIQLLKNESEKEEPRSSLF